MCRHANYKNGRIQLDKEENAEIGQNIQNAGNSESCVPGAWVPGNKVAKLS